MIFELIFLIYFLVRLFHHMYFEEAHIFWKDPKNITVLVITIVSIYEVYVSFSQLFMSLTVSYVTFISAHRNGYVMFCDVERAGTP